MEAVLVLVCLIVAGLAGALTAQASAPSAGKDRLPVTYHWLLEEADDAYLLCVGRLTVEINGDDSIHLICEGN